MGAQAVGPLPKPRRLREKKMTEKTEEKPSGSYMVVGRAGSGTQRTAASYEVLTVEEAATKWADQWMTENQAIVEVFREEALVRKFHLKRRPDGWLLDDVAEQAAAERVDEKISGMQMLKMIEAMASIALIVDATKLDDDIVGKVRELKDIATAKCGDSAVSFDQALGVAVELKMAIGEISREVGVDASQVEDVVTAVRELAESWNAHQEEMRNVYKELGAESASQALVMIQVLKDECGKRKAERDLAYTLRQVALVKAADVATEKPVERIVFAQRERNTTTSARATVQVTLEIEASGKWGRDTSLAQIDTQAIDSVEQRLARVISLARGSGFGIKVVGDPSIVSIAFDSKP